MRATCRHTRKRLPRLDDERPEDSATIAHLAGCLSCQAEAARYRRLRRHLHGLRQVEVRAPFDMVATVAAELDPPTDEPGRRPRRIEAAAATGAVVAIAGAVAILGWRRAGAA